MWPADPYFGVHLVGELVKTTVWFLEIPFRRDVRSPQHILGVYRPIAAESLQVRITGGPMKQMHEWSMKAFSTTLICPQN
jgi:hypothetical protein